MDDVTLENLSNLKIDDLILLVWIINSIALIVINNIQMKKDKTNKEKEIIKLTRYTVIGVSLIIYAYYVYRNYKRSKNKHVNPKTIFINNLAFLGSILFLISGLVAASVVYLNNQKGN